MVLRVWSNRSPHSLLVKLQNATATLDDSWAVLYKTNHTLAKWLSNCAPWYLPKGGRNICLQRNLPTDVYSSFIHKCQNLEATKTTFSRWIDKLWYIQIIKYYSLLKKNELSSHEKVWRNLKCTFLNARSQSDSAIYCMIPIVWHSGQRKTVEQWIDQWLPRVGGRKG